MNSLMKNATGLETAFEINISKTLLRHLMAVYIDNHKDDEAFMFSYREFAGYVLDYGGGSMCIAAWVTEIYNEYIALAGV